MATHVEEAYSEREQKDDGESDEPTFAFDTEGDTMHRNHRRRSRSSCISRSSSTACRSKCVKRDSFRIQPMLTRRSRTCSARRVGTRVVIRSG